MRRVVRRPTIAEINMLLACIWHASSMHPVDRRAAGISPRPRGSQCGERDYDLLMDLLAEYFSSPMSMTAIYGYTAGVW